MYGYSDAVLGPQRDGGEWFDGMAGHEAELKLLLDHSEKQGSLQHGEGCADTNPRTTAKREIGESWDFSQADGIFAPAFGIKCVRIREETRVALCQ